MSDKKSEWVYDELLCFLGSAFFQVPVTGFMEQTCLIFDPSVEDSTEYKKIHRDYKKVVEALLEAFIQDSRLTHDQVIKALNEMNSKKDIRDVFQGLFEQVLAMDDFEIFVSLMTQKNIELQQQALILIMKTTGHLPDSLTEGESKAPPPQANAPLGGADSEDEIMRRVMEQSKREYEEEQKRNKKTEKIDKKQVDTMIELSKHEVMHLESQKQTEKGKMNLAMANMKISDMPPLTQPSPVKVPTPQKPVVQKPVQPVIKTPGVSQTTLGTGVSQTSLGPGLEQMPKLPGITSSQAAANWLKSAQDESSSESHTTAVQKAAAAMAGMSQEELKKRQEHLRQQRDKLLEMKKKEREKQLLSAEQSNPSRPMSSRAARQSLQGEKSVESDKPKQLSEEEQKKIEMRRTIANKLKAELMGDK